MPQFLLSELEYETLKAAPAVVQHKANEVLQNLCTRVANHEPVVWGWGTTPDPKPWGCILTKGQWYCDQCPVSDMCPHPNKEWSK